MKHNSPLKSPFCSSFVTFDRYILAGSTTEDSNHEEQILSESWRSKSNHATSVTANSTLGFLSPRSSFQCAQVFTEISGSFWTKLYTSLLFPQRTISVCCVFLNSSATLDVHIVYGCKRAPDWLISEAASSTDIDSTDIKTAKIFQESKRAETPHQLRKLTTRQRDSWIDRTMRLSHVGNAVGQKTWRSGKGPTVSPSATGQHIFANRHKNGRRTNCSTEKLINGNYS